MLVDHTLSWESKQRHRVLAATSLSAWTCPICGGPFALTSVLKSPRQARYRVRLECARQDCQGFDLVARVHDRGLFEKLAGVLMRNVRSLVGVVSGGPP